ncbi:hypothetical protein [Candidatus Caldatribacterium sp.]|uniref:hypothetical protein n=1 Tax=Candidatus Caldatribacterium sp. TaxID=2282143 RepID=UPI0029957AA8|nr:hypothetical protein [Candidatus Caldatribacterium sp.]MDW8081847.1 hypothetical protein [Candidatus Calescibacterium sp.]
MEKDAFRKAVLVAEKSDSSDIFIGEVLGITFRKLEHFIAEACEASVSYIQVSPVYRLLETKEAPEGNNDCLELSPSRGLSHTPWGYWRNWSFYVPITWFSSAWKLGYCA